MDFTELEAFTVLARTLHFARAAAALHTSPSGLSRLVGRLEDELGVCLLERDTRRVALTEEGEAFRAFAEETLRSRDQLRLRLGSRDGKLRGSLRLYASVTACYTILPPFAEALHADHPDLKFSVDTGDPADAEGAVRAGKADLAVAALPPGGFSDLACFSVRHTPLVLAAPKRGPWSDLDLDPDGSLEAAGSPGQAGDRNGTRPPAATLTVREAEHTAKLVRVLGSVPLILARSGLSRVRFDRWARIHGIRPHIAAEAAGNEAVFALSRLGLGLGLAPRLVLENTPFAGSLALYAAGSGFGYYDIGFVFCHEGSAAVGRGPGRAVIRAISALLEKVYPDGGWITGDAPERNGEPENGAGPGASGGIETDPGTTAQNGAT